MSNYCLHFCLAFSTDINNLNNNLNIIHNLLGFPDAKWVKNLPAMKEVQSLGQEDPLEEEMATHSSILAWEIPCHVMCPRYRGVWWATAQRVTKCRTQMSMPT